MPTWKKWHSMEEKTQGLESQRVSIAFHFYHLLTSRILGKLPNFSDPQFSRLGNGENGLTS